MKFFSGMVTVTSGLGLGRPWKLQCLKEELPGDELAYGSLTMNK